MDSEALTGGVYLPTPIAHKARRQHDREAGQQEYAAAHCLIKNGQFKLFGRFKLFGSG